jgi:hypothetical protein
VELRRGVFKPEAILKRIDEMAAELAEAQERNYQRWKLLGQHVNPNWFVGDTFEEEINWMKAWIEARIAWIDSQFLPPPAVTRLKQGSHRGHVQLTAASGEVYHTLDGSDPRGPGGEISSKAQQYSEPVALPEGVRLFARARAGETWSGPAR